MRIVRIQSDKKYAKLDDDITFTIEYESPLTDEEMNTDWDIYVAVCYSVIMISTHQILSFGKRDDSVQFAFTVYVIYRYLDRMNPNLSFFMYEWVNG